MIGLESGTDYEVLGRVARLEHQTDTSAMLQLGRIGGTLEVSGRTINCGEGRVFTVNGWIDIHYPCHGFHKLAIRSLCPDINDTFAGMHDLVSSVRRWLDLDDDVSYDVMLIVGDTHHSMQDPIEGIPSYTNRDSFDVPEGFWDEWDMRWRDKPGDSTDFDTGDGG